jgi:hypothetical protein
MKQIKLNQNKTIPLCSGDRSREPPNCKECLTNVKVLKELAQKPHNEKKIQTLLLTKFCPLVVDPAAKKLCFKRARTNLPLVIKILKSLSARAICTDLVKTCQ